ncbi:MAG TPA: LysR family transcriptional regulator [Polyangiaceae bacterium]
MIDRFEALAALHRTGTMGRAAAVLRVTQSAISKRIAALEAEAGTKLIEQHGRRVRLTPDAEALLEEARPLLARLRESLHARARRHPPVRAAATDSLLASWLPSVLREALDRSPGLTLELHAHRGPALVERVRSGEYAIGFCPSVASDKELVVREVAREPMVIVPSRLEPLPRSTERERLLVWTIETRSLTWEAIAPRLPRLARRAGITLEVVNRLESFTALVQVARAGFGHALVPMGVARELGVPLDRLSRLGDLSRPIAAVARRSVFERSGVVQLLSELEPLWPRY